MTVLSLIRSRRTVVALGLLFFLVEIWEPSTNFVRAGVQDETVNTVAASIHVTPEATPLATVSYVVAQTSDNAMHFSPGVPGEHSSVGISLFGFHSKESDSRHFVVDLISDPSGFRPSIKQPPISFIA